MMIKTAVAVLILAWSCATAQASALVKLAPESSIWLEGDSTLHAFASTATIVDFSLALTPAAAGQTLAADIESQAPGQMTVRIPVTGLKSGQNGLDKNLYKALDAEKHPEIVFAMSGYKIVSAPEGVSVVASGDLTISGQKRPVEVQGKLSTKNGRSLIDGQHQLLMTDFGIKPPKMMMGAIKTKDRIVVKFHLELEPAADGKQGGGK